MLKKIIPLLLIILLLPIGVRAQEPVAFSEVQVSLWPEYDKPSMLVIYRITLNPQTSLPVEIFLRIPEAAGVPNAVAVRQPDGLLVTTPYEQELDTGGWTKLVFQATTPDIQIEYYDPTLSKEGGARHFDYNWPGDYAVQVFNIEVQQPAGASQMTISPSLGAGRVAGDGLQYFSSEVGSLSTGQSFTISIDYQKASDDLSVSSMPVAPSGPLETGGASLTMQSALPWVLGALGLILIAGGGIWYWRSGREQVQPKRKRVRRKPTTPRAPEPEEGGHVYCHKCGKRAQAGDRFCRACGTALRTG